MQNKNHWDFVHSPAKDASWIPGLREIFDYRDLGVKEGSKGDFVAHVIRHNGSKTQNSVQNWHIHECDFQYVFVLKGWATFEYDGEGHKTIRAGDGILQKPFIRHREIACSEDLELLEIVSPADFITREVDAPDS